MDAFMESLFNPHTAAIISKLSAIAIISMGVIAGIQALWRRS